MSQKVLKLYSWLVSNARRCSRGCYPVERLLLLKRSFGILSIKAHASMLKLLEAERKSLQYFFVHGFVHMVV